MNEETLLVPPSRGLKVAFAVVAIGGSAAIFGYTAVRKLVLVPEAEQRALDVLPQSFAAPEFSLPDAHGAAVSLAQYRGKVVMLNFWASWCPPCREEMPTMAQLATDLAPHRDFAMLAVSVDDGWGPINDYLKQAFPQAAPAFTVLLDDGGKVSEAYGTNKYPETYLIGRDGRAIAKFIGPRDWEAPAAKRYLQKLLE